MPIDNNEENLIRWERSWRYQLWKIEKRVSEEEAKAEWIKWTKKQGWQLETKTKPLETKSKPSGIPKPLWIALAIAIIFLIVAWLI